MNPWLQRFMMLHSQMVSKLGGPYAWKERKGFSFFQGPDAASILRRGVKNILEETTDGLAETKGNEK